MDDDDPDADLPVGYAERRRRQQWKEQQEEEEGGGEGGEKGAYAEYEGTQHSRDPWAPVQVPFGAPPALNPTPPLFGAGAAGTEAEEAQEEADLIFLQLPTALPPLRRDRLRVDRPGGVAAHILGPDLQAQQQAQQQAQAQAQFRAAAGAGAVPAAAAAQSKKPVPPVGSAVAVPVSAAARSAAHALQELTVPAGMGDHRQGALGELTQGFLGTIQVHASGRCVLLLGGSSYELRPGAATAFAQQVATVRTGGHPITRAAAKAAEAAANSSASAAAAAFKHEDGGSDGGGMHDDDDDDDDGGGGGGGRGEGRLAPSVASGSSSQAAAAAAAAAKAKAAFTAAATSGPRSFTVLGPVTKRVLAVPTLPTLLGQAEPGEAAGPVGLAAAAVV